VCLVENKILVCELWLEPELSRAVSSRAASQWLLAGAKPLDAGATVSRAKPSRGNTKAERDKYYSFDLRGHSSIGQITAD